MPSNIILHLGNIIASAIEMSHDKTISKVNRIIFFISIFLLQSNFMLAQKDRTFQKLRVRNVVWFTPVNRSTIINGIAISVLPSCCYKDDSLAINGLLIDAGPLAFLGIVSMMGSTLFFNLEPSDDPIVEWDPDRRMDLRIRGLSLSTGLIAGDRDIDVNGVSLNMLGCTARSINGLEISGITNINYSFKGIVASFLGNRASIGKGVQIGLINRCKEGRLLQIGLINKIGKRIVPFINFSFKKKKKQPDHL